MNKINLSPKNKLISIAQDIANKEKDGVKNTTRLALIALSAWGTIYYTAIILGQIVKNVMRLKNKKIITPTVQNTKQKINDSFHLIFTSRKAKTNKEVVVGFLQTKFVSFPEYNDKFWDISFETREKTEVLLDYLKSYVQDRPYDKQRWGYLKKKFRNEELIDCLKKNFPNFLDYPSFVKVLILEFPDVAANYFVNYTEKEKIKIDKLFYYCINHPDAQLDDVKALMIFFNRLENKGFSQYFNREICKKYLYLKPNIQFMDWIEDNYVEAVINFFTVREGNIPESGLLTYILRHKREKLWKTIQGNPDQIKLCLSEHYASEQRFNPDFELMVTLLRYSNIDTPLANQFQQTLCRLLKSYDVFGFYFDNLDKDGMQQHVQRLQKEFPQILKELIINPQGLLFKSLWELRFEKIYQKFKMLNKILKQDVLNLFDLEVFGKQASLSSEKFPNLIANTRFINPMTSNRLLRKYGYKYFKEKEFIRLLPKMGSAGSFCLLKLYQNEPTLFHEFKLESKSLEFTIEDLVNPEIKYTLLDILELTPNLEQIVIVESSIKEFPKLFEVFKAYTHDKFEQVSIDLHAFLPGTPLWEDTPVPIQDDKRFYPILNQFHLMKKWGKDSNQQELDVSKIDAEWWNFIFMGKGSLKTLAEISNWLKTQNQPVVPLTYQKALKPTADGSILSLRKQENGEELAAHSIILSKSPTFKNMLFGNFTPTNKDFEFLTEYSFKAIRAVIQFLYLDPNWFNDFSTGQEEEEKTVQQLTELIVLADYLRLEDLVRNGEEKLVSLLKGLKEEHQKVDFSGLQDFCTDYPSLTKLKAFLEKNNS